jgi:hypothetical protein
VLIDLDLVREGVLLRDLLRDLVRDLLRDLLMVTDLILVAMIILPFALLRRARALLLALVTNFSPKIDPLPIAPPPSFVICFLLGIRFERRIVKSPMELVPFSPPEVVSFYWCRGTEQVHWTWLQLSFPLWALPPNFESIALKYFKIQREWTEEPTKLLLGLHTELTRRKLVCGCHVTCTDTPQ